MLYVHKNWQGQGIASALLADRERQARAHAQTSLTMAASRVARPFSEARGFDLLGAEDVQRLGQELERFPHGQDDCRAQRALEIH